jgi:hypothetical protein
MTAVRRLGLVGVLPLYLAAATAMGFVDYHIRTYPDLGYEKYSPSVIAGNAEAPGRYRVLAPYAYEGVRRATGLSPLYAWLVFRWLSLLLALLATHLYLRTWFETGKAVAGNMLMFALMPLTFTNAWPHPDHFVELFLFTLGCACIARGWFGTFVLVLGLNALNRETSVFLLALFSLATPDSAGHRGRTIACTVLWAAIYVGLRWALGFETYDAWQARRNFGWLLPMSPNYPPYYRIRGWFYLLLLVPCFWLAARSWRVQPRFVRVATAFVAPAFVVVGFLFSSVIEARIFAPLMPLLLPAMLVTLFPTDAPTSESPRGL